MLSDAKCNFRGGGKRKWRFFRLLFLTQIVKQVSSSLSWRSCSGLSKSGHSYWVRDNGLQQSQIILWGHRGWDRSLCSSWDSQLVFAISQSIHSPGNFPLPFGRWNKSNILGSFIRWENHFLSSFQCAQKAWPCCPSSLGPTTQQD